jgi:hypothetical protein
LLHNLFVDTAPLDIPLDPLLAACWLQHVLEQAQRAHYIEAKKVRQAVATAVSLCHIKVIANRAINSLQ